jgi:hypothetical protein
VVVVVVVVTGRTTTPRLASRPEEAPDFMVASIDFLVRSHVLGELVPALIPPEFGDDIARAELWSFSLYGREARFATPHRFSPAPPLGIVRNASGERGNGPIE